MPFENIILSLITLIIAVHSDDEFDHSDDFQYDFFINVKTESPAYLPKGTTQTRLEFEGAFANPTFDVDKTIFQFRPIFEITDNGPKYKWIHYNLKDDTHILQHVIYKKEEGYISTGEEWLKKTGEQWLKDIVLGKVWSFQNHFHLKLKGDFIQIILPCGIYDRFLSQKYIAPTTEFMNMGSQCNVFQITDYNAVGETSKLLYDINELKFRANCGFKYNNNIWEFKGRYGRQQNPLRVRLDKYSVRGHHLFWTKQKRMELVDVEYIKERLRNKGDIILNALGKWGQIRIGANIIECKGSTVGAHLMMNVLLDDGYEYEEDDMVRMYQDLVKKYEELSRLLKYYDGGND